MRADHRRFDKVLGRMAGTRGARSLRSLATRPYTPPPGPAHWQQPLHVLEFVDAALRAALQARPRSDPHRAYLLEWVDQVDTTPNVLTPHALRGARPDYANPKLVNTPFPDAAPSAKTDPIQFPRTQRTAYTPRKLTGILFPWAIKKLAKALRGVVANLRAWLTRPKRPRRQAKPLVIGQDGSLPEARGIGWVLERMLVDELGPYFAPIDFTAATGTSLNTEFLDKALEHSDDQALLSMLVYGFVFGFDAELQIAVLPHLLSLALGVERGTKQLRRLIGEGYFRAVNATSAHLLGSPTTTSCWRSNSSRAACKLKAWPRGRSRTGRAARKTAGSRASRCATASASLCGRSTPSPVRSRTATQQLLVSKVQCGTHARSGRGPGSAATVVSEKELKEKDDGPD